MNHKIFKKIGIILVTFIISLNAVATVAIAADDSPLIPKITPQPDSKVILVQNLPKGTWQSVLANAINLILAITASLALIAFVVGGLMMIGALGNEEQINKGKSILMWSVMALAVIAASYGIVLGLTQLQIFQ